MRALKTSFAFLLIFSAQLLSGTKGGIKGRVLDENNQPIVGAIITIVSLEHPSEKYALKTNKRGEFIQIGLEPGFFQVQGSKETYAPSQAQVRVLLLEHAEVTLILSTKEKVVGEDKTRGKAASDRGHQLYAQGKFEDALKEYQVAVLNNPDLATNHYNLGVVYMNLNRDDEAIEAFKKTIEIRPDIHSALKYLGQLYGRKNEYEQAKKYLTLAAGVSSDDAEIFYSLGVILVNTADYLGASAAFQKAIALRVDYADAYYQLGLVYVNQNKLNEAIATFEMFLSISPNDLQAQNVRMLIESTKKK